MYYLLLFRWGLIWLIERCYNVLKKNEFERLNISNFGQHNVLLSRQHSGFGIDIINSDYVIGNDWYIGYEYDIRIMSVPSGSWH